MRLPKDSKIIKKAQNENLIPVSAKNIVLLNSEGLKAIFA